MNEELEKISSVKEKSQAIGEFLDWIRGTKNWFLCQYSKTEDERPCQVHYNIEALLAEYFDIDLKKAESERRAILEQLQKKEVKS